MDILVFFFQNCLKICKKITFLTQIFQFFQSWQYDTIVLIFLNLYIPYLVLMQLSLPLQRTAQNLCLSHWIPWRSPWSVLLLLHYLRNVKGNRDKTCYLNNVYNNIIVFCLCVICFQICNPLQQNQEQVLFFINWVIGFIRKNRTFSDDLTPKSWLYSICLQKFNVRKGWLKFTFYTDINAGKSWECIIWWTKQW